MTMITVKKILSAQFPEKNGVWADSDFAKVESVSFIEQGIKEIDNLDLFDNITVLNLQKNKIQRIENISHLTKLHYLDLSDNDIDEEGLRTERLPPNLKTLKLTGNPCVANSQIILTLKNDYPNVQFVLDSEEDSYPPAAGTDVSLVVNPATPSLSSTSVNSEEYLDSESVLRAVVDRKCKLQSLAPVDIASTLHNLEKEYDDVTMASRNRRNNPQTPSVDSESPLLDVTMAHAPRYQSRLSELKAVTAKGSDGSGSSTFFDKLRAESFKKYDEKIKENKILVNNE